MKKKIISLIFGLSILTCATLSVQAASLKPRHEQKLDNLYVQQSHHQREQDYIGYRRREELLRQQREENERVGLLASEFTRKRDYIGLGNLYYSNGYLRYAIDAYTMMIEANPKNSTGYFLRGRVKGDQNNLQGAIADYDIAITLNPQSDGAYINRAVDKFRLKDKNGSLQDFRSAARIYKATGNTADFEDTMRRIRNLFKVPE
jgi:tetratricopeptide (TPR) repeat protein